MYETASLELDMLTPHQREKVKADKKHHRPWCGAWPGLRPRPQADSTRAYIPPVGKAAPHPAGDSLGVRRERWLTGNGQ